MAENRKSFGQKGAVKPAPTILHAPGGLPSGHPGPSPVRKASMTVALLAVGATSMAGGAAYLAHRRSEACRPDAQTPGGRPPECDTRSSGGGYGGSSTHWWGYSSSGSSWSSTGHATSTSSPSGGHASFGGFGATGAGHSGGHGGGA
jgi:hypothetical protein